MDSENKINARKEENIMAEENVNQTEGSAKAEGKKAIDPNRLGYVIFRGNVKTFMNAVKDGSLPAFSMDGADASGKITMRPVAVRSFTKGQVFTGVNQLVAQKKAAELGLEPDASGSIRLITYRQAGEKNIRKGSPNFELTSYDKEKNRFNYYHLYPMSAVIDPSKVSPGQAPETVPDAKISATDPNMSPKDYFAAYEAATKAGCQFETNRKTVEAVREKTIGMEKDLSSNFKYNSFSAAIESGANNLLLSAAETTQSMERTKDRNVQKEIQKPDNGIEIG